MHYIGISTYQFIPHYASVIHQHMRIIKPFEDSEPTGLKVDIANLPIRPPPYPLPLISLMVSVDINKHHVYVLIY